MNFVQQLQNNPEAIAKVSGARLAPIASQLLQGAPRPSEVWGQLILHPQINKEMFEAAQSDPVVLRNGIARYAREPRLPEIFDAFSDYIKPDAFYTAFPDANKAVDLALYLPKVFAPLRHFYDKAALIESAIDRGFSVEQIVKLLASISLHGTPFASVKKVLDKIFLPRGMKQSLFREMLSKDNSHHEIEHRGLLNLLSALFEHRSDLIHDRKTMAEIEQIKNMLSHHDDDDISAYKDIHKVFGMPL